MARVRVSLSNPALAHGENLSFKRTVAEPLPISVVIVAKNEAGNLPRCLASVHGWVAEIVVALNDTTDESAAIAARFGAHVHTLPWQGYRDTKNAALALAAHNWVLALDADEEVSASLRDDIADFFSRGGTERFAGVSFPRRARFMGRWIRHGDWYPDYSLRLFRRDRAHWGGNGFVHEKIECAGPRQKLRGDLLHYPYASLAVQQRKSMAYAELFVRQHLPTAAAISPVRIISRTVWRFVRSYFLRCGFLDGFPGLVVAALIAHYTFLRYTYLYEAGLHQKRRCLAGFLERIRLIYRAHRYRWKLDPAEIAFVRAYVRPGTTAIDIGAHKGGYTYWMARAIGRAGRVIAFEPQPELAARLRYSFRKQDRVVVENMGVSDQCGKMSLIVPGRKPSPSASFEIIKTAYSDRSIDVQVTTLDSYLLLP
ncbi:MAG: FkbM family methyltransferase, partial [Verrucomicrobiota bacterium]|nr:FkbM family methyltransferase [Verrucomicrobiota bacterium]